TEADEEARLVALRTDAATAADAIRAELGQTLARVEALEQRNRQAADQVAGLVDARVEIGAAVDAALHRVGQAQEKVDEQLRAIGQQAASAAGSVEILDATVTSD